MATRHTTSHLLRVQRLLQPRTCHKLYIKNYHSIQRLFSSSVSDEIPSPPKTAFAAQSSQKPARLNMQKYEYPTDKESALKSAFDHCINELQREEPQIYDTLQYVKCVNDHERLAITVLRVLHLELSRTRTDANTSDAARIRLQWWKSAINEMIKEKNVLVPLKESTPLLTALRVVRRRYNLNSNWLMRLVSAREVFLTSNTFMSMLELEEYAESTQTMLLYLSMEVLTVAYSSRQNHFKCASHVGVFMTIATVLRSIPYSVKNGFIALPDDIASDCDVWRFERSVLDDHKSTLQLKHAVEKMVVSAYQHLYAAKDLEKEGMTDNIKSLFLCSMAAQRYLIQLEKVGFDVFSTKLLAMDMGLSWKMELVKKSMRNTF